MSRPGSFSFFIKSGSPKRLRPCYKGYFMGAFFVSAILVGFYAWEAQGITVNEFTFDFQRDLSVGSTGLDVYHLQVFLNRDTDTKLAVTGAGSPGLETEYFGPITKNALIRFQEKYADEILTPLGLSHGTGYFGRSTRTKINNLLSGSEVLPPEGDVSDDREREEEVSEVSEDPLMHTDELMLTQVSNYYGERGTTLSLYGFGFTSDNTIHFGDALSVRNVRAESHDTLKITVPEELDLGYYDLQVENEKGRDTESQVFFVVVDESSVSPKVSSISPRKAGPGETVTVYGEGFDRDWNMIRTTFFITEGRSSADGRSLTFRIPDLLLNEGPDVDDVDIESEVPEDAPVPEVNSVDKWEFETYVYVVNNGGVETEPVSFMLEL